MESCIYEGRVKHSRSRPARHQFSYRLFLMYLDLDELDTLFEKRWFWSASRPALARFRRSDHMGREDQPLADAVRDRVEKETGRRPSGSIRLLTNLSYFGYCFNPVSFYYCFSADGEHVEYIVSEVHNTPWGERDTYLLDCRKTAMFESSWRFRPRRRCMSRHLCRCRSNTTGYCLNRPINCRYSWRIRRRAFESSAQR